MVLSAPPSSAGPTDRQVRAAQYAASALFFGFGLLYATLGLNIPGLRDALALSDAQVGVGLLAVSAGSLLTMPLTGRLTERWGSARISGLGATLTFAALLLPFLAAQAGSFLWLLAGFLALGLANGLLDVALSAQGVTAEQHAGRPLMSRLHAFYSLGGLTGAATGGLLVGRVSMLQHAGLVVAALLLLTFWAVPRLLPDVPPAADHAPAAAEAPAGAEATASQSALLLGFLCFLGMFTEGVNYDWASVYYRDVLGVQAGQVAWGYGAFSGMMAVGRWFGDRLRATTGDLHAVRFGALLAAVGMGLALAVPDPLVSTLGFALSGLGLSNVVPVMYSVAGHALAGRGIARVASIGYAGFLLGPPLIGFLSDTAGLRLSLTLAALGGFLVFWFSGPVFARLRPQAR